MAPGLLWHITLTNCVCVFPRKSCLWRLSKLVRERNFRNLKKKALGSLSSILVLQGHTTPSSTKLICQDLQFWKPVQENKKNCEAHQSLQTRPYYVDNRHTLFLKEMCAGTMDTSPLLSFPTTPVEFSSHLLLFVLNPIRLSAIWEVLKLTLVRKNQKISQRKTMEVAEKSEHRITASQNRQPKCCARSTILTCEKLQVLFFVLWWILYGFCEPISQYVLALISYIMIPYTPNNCTRLLFCVQIGGTRRNERVLLSECLQVFDQESVTFLLLELTGKCVWTCLCFVKLKWRKYFLCSSIVKKSLKRSHKYLSFYSSLGQNKSKKLTDWRKDN